jgi:hypothetical protein
MNGFAYCSVRTNPRALQPDGDDSACDNAIRPLLVRSSAAQTARKAKPSSKRFSRKSRVRSGAKECGPPSGAPAKMTWNGGDIGKILRHNRRKIRRSSPASVCWATTACSPGDIVSTNKGLFVFRGKADQPRSNEDFLPLQPG